MNIISKTYCFDVRIVVTIINRGLNSGGHVVLAYHCAIIYMGNDFGNDNINIIILHYMVSTRFIPFKLYKSF